jgi:hypothetical protein
MIVFGSSGGIAKLLHNLVSEPPCVPGFSIRTGGIPGRGHHLAIADLGASLREDVHKMTHDTQRR